MFHSMELEMGLQGFNMAKIFQWKKERWREPSVRESLAVEAGENFYYVVWGKGVARGERGEIPRPPKPKKLL